MNLQTKEAILKRHETYCYQICYYFVEDEQGAFLAAREALMVLAYDSTFLDECHENQKRKVRHAAFRSSLKIAQRGKLVLY